MITLLGERKTREDGIQIYMGIRSVDKRVDPTLSTLADHAPVMVPGIIEMCLTLQEEVHEQQKVSPCW